MKQQTPEQPIPNRNWYAFYMKPRHEKKASERLEGRFHIYCPLKEERVKWSDRWKTVEKPWLPGYLFACVTEKERLSVLQDPSVFRTVCIKGKPAAIREQEIQNLQTVLGETNCENVELEQLRPGGRVEITGGSLRTMKGVIVTIIGKRASLRLDSLNCAITFTVPAAVLKPV